MGEAVDRGAIVAKGASYLLIRSLVGSAAGLIYYAFASRILSVSEIGVVSALTIVASLLLTFGTLAIPSAATKHIAEYSGKERADIVAGIYKKVVTFGFLTSILSSFIFFLLATPISLFVSGNNTYEPLIQLMAIDIFALVFSPFFHSILLGLQNFRKIAFTDMLRTILKYSGSLVLLKLGLGLTGVVIGWVIGDFVGLVLVYAFVSKLVQSSATTYPFKELVKYSAPLLASTTLSYFAMFADHYVVLLLAGVTALGIYSIALAPTSAVQLVYASLGGSLFPQMSELYGRHGTQALKLASYKVSRYIFFISTPLALGLAVVARPALVLFFGPQYESGWLSLVIVSTSMALTCMSVVVDSLLLSLGSTRTFLEANVLAVAVATLSSIILVLQFAIAGAALARAALAAVLLLYPVWRLKKIFGLSFDGEAFWKSWLGSLIMALVVLFAELVFKNPLFLPLYILAGGFMYFLMLRFLKAAKSDDFMLIEQILPKQFSKTINLLARLLK